MNIESFKETLAKDEPPELSHALRALWWDAKGDWDKAHASAQQDEQSPEGTWVHAYLHRKEGDLSNPRSRRNGRRSRAPCSRRHSGSPPSAGATARRLNSRQSPGMLRPDWSIRGT